jgi:hypothetical protein
MKNTISIILILAFGAISMQAQIFDKLKDKAAKEAKKEAQKYLDKKKTGYSADEAGKAIKEALIQGVSKGSDVLSRTDGFFKNPEVKIPFPPEAQKVESTLRSVGMGKTADDAILAINRAAENAAVEAKDVFVGAIKQMTVTDAVNIVKGDSGAATKYLRAKTTAQLKTKFTPIINKSLEKTDATKYWSTAMNAYNQVPLVEKVNPNLSAYVTEKAMNALFLMIAKEEAEIRRDPLKQTTELLKKVFGKK